MWVLKDYLIQDSSRTSEPHIWLLQNICHIDHGKISYKVVEKLVSGRLRKYDCTLFGRGMPCIVEICHGRYKVLNTLGMHSVPMCPLGVHLGCHLFPQEHKRHVPHHSMQQLFCYITSWIVWFIVQCWKNLVSKLVSISLPLFVWRSSFSVVNLVYMCLNLASDGNYSVLQLNKSDSTSE